jgi:hypothetical protein
VIIFQARWRYKYAADFHITVLDYDIGGHRYPRPERELRQPIVIPELRWNQARDSITFGGKPCKVVKSTPDHEKAAAALARGAMMDGIYIRESMNGIYYIAVRSPRGRQKVVHNAGQTNGCGHAHRSMRSAVPHAPTSLPPSVQRRCPCRARSV